MLRSAPRALTEAEARGAARRALGPSVDVIPGPPIDEHATGYIVRLDGAGGRAPGFFIINARRPYGDDAAAESLRFEDPRARAAYAAHTAWIAIDIAGGMPPPGVRDEVLRLMARLAGEFYDEHCTMLYAPALGRVALASPEVESTLRGSDPFSIFRDDEVNTPIANIGAEDRRVRRAMAEARRQWPTFLEVWGRHGAACHPMVKGKFESPEAVEYMWIEVKAVQNGSVRGVLVNEPAHVKGIRKGQEVRVAEGDVADWACLDGETTHGLFVERVIRERRVR